MLTISMLAVRNFNHFNKNIQTFFLSIDLIKARFSLKVKENYCCSIKNFVPLFLFPFRRREKHSRWTKNFGANRFNVVSLIYWKKIYSMHRQNFSFVRCFIVVSMTVDSSSYTDILVNSSRLFTIHWKNLTMFMRKQKMTSKKSEKVFQFSLETPRDSMETVMTVELTRLPKKDEPPKLDKCCFFLSLRLGLNIWLAIESCLWIFLFVSALYFEIVFVGEVELLQFKSRTQVWYFYLIFGDRLDYVDLKIRSE